MTQELAAARAQAVIGHGKLDVRGLDGVNVSGAQPLTKGEHLDSGISSESRVGNDTVLDGIGGPGADRDRA